MKTVILLCSLMTVPALWAEAQEKPAAARPLPLPALISADSPRTGQAAVMAKIDAIDMANIDLEAQYWAWRVDKVKDTSYEDLKAKSARWIGNKDTKQKLFVKIQAHLDKRPVPALTAEQRSTYDAYKQEIRKLLSPGAYDQEAIKNLTPDYCIELKARYWAGRVEKGEKIILDSMQRWSFKDKQIKERVLTRIEELAKAENAPLTMNEMYIFDACGTVLR